MKKQPGSVRLDDPATDAAATLPRRGFLKGIAAGIFPTRNVLIVETGAPALQIAKHLAATPQNQRVLRGFLGPHGSSGPAVLGTVDDLPRIARAEFVDEIIIASGSDRALAEQAVVEALQNHLDVSIVPDLLEQHPPKLSIESIGPVPLISIHEEPIPRLGLFFKRLLDIAISAVALIVVLPLLVLIGLLIKLESPGPALYVAPPGRQERQEISLLQVPHHARRRRSAEGGVARPQ
jgi:hypothetical protein